MKRNLTGYILAFALFISFFLTGNTFANTYSFVLENNSDTIKIFDMDGKTQKAMIDLSADPQADTTPPVDDDGNVLPFTADGTVNEIITDMIVNRYGNYLYFVTENVADSSGQLYRLNIGLYINDDNPNDGTQPFSTITPLTSVGESPVALAEGPLGYAIYVANFGDDSITKFDMNPIYSTPVATTISGYYQPVAIAVTKGHDVFIANSEKNADDQYVVSIYNTYRRGEIVLENSPTDIVITPDFEYVYVCNSPVGSGLISVIKPEDYLDLDDDGDDIYDVGENTIVDSISITGSVPTKLAFIEGGNKIIAADPVSQIVSEVDSSGRMNEINEFSENHSNLTGYAGLSGMFGAQDGSAIYTVTGVDKNVYVTDLTTKITEVSTVFAAAVGSFQDIVIRSAVPKPVTKLETDVALGVTTLEWYDDSDNETGFLIYRLDHDDDSKEYKYYLLEKVENENLRVYQNLTIYEDTSVRKGKRYSYRVIPYNDFARGVNSLDATAKAKDSSDTEICFITGTDSDNNTMLTGLMLLSLMVIALPALLRKRL